MTSITVGERNERRRNEIANQIIRDYSPIRFGSGMWNRLVALIGIGASDIDYIPGVDDGEPPQEARWD
jgi:hypothetical protein